MADSAIWPNRNIALAAVLLLGFAVPSSSMAKDRWYLSGFAGVMTENVWEEIFDPNSLKLAGSNLIGLAVGWEQPIDNSRFSIGFEVQAVGHFGRQDHFEFNLPLIVRYVPPPPQPFSFKSAAFGIGPSFATKLPQVEIDTHGETGRQLVYWTAELEFSLPKSDKSLLLRLHHRSDGYGLYDVNSGSTAIVLGWRKLF